MRVFTRPDGPSRRRARDDGFPPAPVEALGECRALGILVADEAVDDVLGALVNPHASSGCLLVFAHGFALRHPGPNRPRTDLDVALVGPLGPGALLRERYVAGAGLAGLLAVVHDGSGSARDRALAWAAAIGLTRAGVLPTTLEEEVVSDLFAEQVVLVGGAVELVRAAWETLTEHGISAEVAYFSCVQELKQILDLVHQAGPAGMRAMISGTAQFGGLTRGPRIVGEESRREMRRVLEEIVSGDFAREWSTERAAHRERLAQLLQREADHPMERAGKAVRQGFRSPGG